MIRKIGLYPVVAIVVFCCGVAAWSVFPQRRAVAEPPTTTVDLTAGETGINLRRTVTVRVVQKTKDAVVNISALKLVDRQVTIQGPFAQPFATGETVRVAANSLGSGFIIHRDGYVVTNNHVIDRARQISVELADGRKLPADLISADPDADLAILKIHSDTPLPTIELGDSSDLMIGEPAIAVGNPMGFSHSVSTGIVASLHRDIGTDPAEQKTSDQPVHGEEAALRDLIQTDAAINPGNSGGPLLNAYGQVIGINTAIESHAQNIGFAIPIDRLRDLIPDLMNPSQVVKVDVPVKLMEKRTITEPATVNATIVSTGPKPVQLESINGQHPTDIIDAYAMLLKFKPNQAIDVCWTGNQTQKLMTKASPIPDAIVQARRLFGLSIEQVTPMLADKHQLKQEDGLYIDNVDPDGPATKAGLAKGDVIVQVGSVRIISLDDFGALVPRLPESGAIRVWVLRGPVMGHVTLKFGTTP
jgi:serine protease Do